MDNMVQYWKEEYQRCTEECKRAREDAEKHKSGGGGVAAAIAMKYQKVWVIILAKIRFENSGNWHSCGCIDFGSGEFVWPQSKKCL